MRSRKGHAVTWKYFRTPKGAVAYAGRLEVLGVHCWIERLLSGYRVHVAG